MGAKFGKDLDVVWMQKSLNVSKLFIREEYKSQSGC